MTAPVFTARCDPNGRFETTGAAAYQAGRRFGNDGIFAGWRWENDRLIVENDRWGVQPLFWSSAPGTIRVSSSVAALLAAGVPADLDEAAMAVFLRTGFFVGDDTPFAAIRATPPSASFVWTRDGLAISSRWHSPRRSTIARGPALRRFAECFTAAVQTRLRTATDPAAVPLSGGHDSRHILLAMNELQRLPDCCVTVHPYRPASDEVAIARTVAGALGVRHVVLPQRRDRVAAEREKHPLTHYCSDEHVQFLPLRDYFSRHRYEIFDGLAGDVLSQSQRLDRSLHRAFVDGQFERVAECVLGDATVIEPALARLLTGEAAVRFNRRLAATRIAGEAVHHAGAPNPIAAFFFLSRMRREIALAPYALLDVGPVSTPFLDDEVVDLLLSLPFDLVADRTFHTETLRARYPERAHILFESKRRGADDRAAVRRDAAAFLRVVFESRSALLNRAAVAARTLRALATGVSADLWFIPRLAHLIAVERPAVAANPFPPASVSRPTATV